MVKKSKYEVMEEEESILSLSIFFYNKVLLKLAEDYDENGEYEFDSIEAFERATCDITRKMFPHLKMMSHLGYENARDLFSVDLRDLKNYFSSKEVSFREFERNYSKVLNRYAKNLFVFLIIEEEGIDIANINKPMALVQLMKGNTSPILEMMNSNLIKLKQENQEVVDMMVSDDFNIGALSSEQILRLNNYHDKFMNEKIYPRVNDEKVSEDSVVKQAKRIGQLGPFN